MKNMPEEAVRLFLVCKGSIRLVSFTCRSFAVARTLPLHIIE